MVSRFPARHSIASRWRLSRDEKVLRIREAILSEGLPGDSSRGAAAAVAPGSSKKRAWPRARSITILALFDQLLPYEGLLMRAWTEEAACAEPPVIGREIVRFKAFLDYLSENEGFCRSLHEAEISGPKAHHAHF